MGIWLIDLRCKELQIFKKDFPVYFSYISKGMVLPIENALNHEATREFSEMYFEPLSICSTIDSPIFIQDQLFAIICCEVSYKTRNWKNADIELIKAFSKLLSLIIEKYYLKS